MRALFCVVAQNHHPPDVATLSRKTQRRRRPKRLLHEIVYRDAKTLDFFAAGARRRRPIRSRLRRRSRETSSSSSLPLQKGFATGFTEHDHHPVKPFVGSCCASAKRRRRRRRGPQKTRAVFRRRETTSRETTTNNNNNNFAMMMMMMMKKTLGMMNELCVPVLTVTAALAHAFLINAETTRATNAIVGMLYAIASRVILLKMLAAFWCTVDVHSYAMYALFPWRPKKEFENAKVLITGASQGLGEEIAYYVSTFGAKVILASRNVKNLEDVGKKCVENGAKGVEVVAFDALKPKSAEGLAQSVSASFNNDDTNSSHCDYAFLCAGASQSASAFDVTEDAERELFDLNALSTIQVLKNILPLMIEQNRGRVCVISSMAAICPAPGQSSYAASKAAVSKYVDSVRAEIGRTANVTLTNCFPGPIATGFNGKKRVVFNATGVNENHPKGIAKGRLPVQTVAQMAVKLTSFGSYSIHLAPKLVMFLSRCVHSCPTVAYAVMDALGPKRARAAKKGESLYELKVKDA